MWYSVLKSELTLQESFAGTSYKVEKGIIYNVRKGVFDNEVGVIATPVDETQSWKKLYLRTKEARQLMTPPTKSLNEAISKSFMLCKV